MAGSAGRSSNTCCVAGAAGPLFLNRHRADAAGMHWSTTIVSRSGPLRTKTGQADRTPDQMAALVNDYRTSIATCSGARALEVTRWRTRKHASGLAGDIRADIVFSSTKICNFFKIAS